MKRYHRICLWVPAGILLLFLAGNLLLNSQSIPSGRPWRVEASRLAAQIEKDGLESADLTQFQYITHVEPLENGSAASLLSAPENYLVVEAGGQYYRVDFNLSDAGPGRARLTLNLCLGAMTLLVLGVLLFVELRILRPFQSIQEAPFALATGNLTQPQKELKGRFFGKFIWGLDLLRETLEEQKSRELRLQKEKKTLLMSLSHDLKTPLAAIKLYAQALSSGLYAEPQKQKETALRISEKAGEIDAFISQIMDAARDEPVHLEVKPGEFYLYDLLWTIESYYTEKLDHLKIPFSLKREGNCLLSGDLDRSVEVLQNLLENAVKYGNGSPISLFARQEENFLLVTIQNGGCKLNEEELPHIFDSFWRGSNTGSQPGSGLGLYICRQIMHKMNGEIFAELKDEILSVTAAFPMA